MNNILLATGISATGVYLLAKAILSFEKFMEKLEKQALQERIEKYEKNGTEQKIIEEYFAKIDKKEKIAMKKLALKKYKTKKEFFKLLKILEIAKAERANGFKVSPARKKFEVKDYEWGYVEYEENIQDLIKEEQERKAKIKEDVKKVLPTILMQYKGKNLEQIKSMSR